MKEGTPAALLLFFSVACLSCPQAPAALLLFFSLNRLSLPLFLTSSTAPFFPAQPRASWCASSPSTVPPLHRASIFEGKFILSSPHRSSWR
ncbi:uncharacterized protein G2W53_012488 [Senna tora]|uniref:Uncharacterized protein n=1 Tax=Senna tora TaxID=362788 RepID=A0A834U1E2_9FABA|nr:uncharacterized protein G2W53_012488 [Senna tora]